MSGKDISRVSCELLQQRCFSANVSAGDEVSEVSLDEFDGNLLLSRSLFSHNNDAERSLSDNFLEFVVLFDGLPFMPEFIF